jgi:hypothetical protein
MPPPFPSPKPTQTPAHTAFAAVARDKRFFKLRPAAAAGRKALISKATASIERPPHCASSKTQSRPYYVSSESADSRACDFQRRRSCLSMKASMTKAYRDAERLSKIVQQCKT